MKCSAFPHEGSGDTRQRHYRTCSFASSRMAIRTALASHHRGLPVAEESATKEMGCGQRQTGVASSLWCRVVLSSGQRRRSLTGLLLLNSQAANRVALADVLSVLAMTMAEEGARDSLKYRLVGGLGDVGSWGHEYIRQLTGEVAAEFSERSENSAKVDDLMVKDRRSPMKPFNSVPSLRFLPAHRRWRVFLACEPARKGRLSCFKTVPFFSDTAFPCGSSRRWSTRSCRST